MRNDTDMSESNEPKQPRRWPRVVAAVAALALVAFCAWSLSEYVHGADPLAWLSSQPALQTTAEENPSSDDTSSALPTASSSDVSKEDVESAVESLSYDGEDVSCQSGDFRVMLKADAGIWVEQVSGDSSHDMVEGTARRLWALCAWVRDRGVDAPLVTWISEDSDGAIRMIVAAAPDDLADDGTVAEILDATESYAIRYVDYGMSIQSEGIAQTKGDVPAYPNGDRATVATTEQEAADQGSQAGADSSASGMDDASATGASSSDTAGSGDAGSQATGSDGAGDSATTGSESPAAEISVTVDGSPAGGSRYTRSVSYRDGMTAYDALVGSGAGINARDTQFGIYVAAIDGLAEKEHGPMSGWVYAVNGTEPNTACSNYVLSAGDVVVWTYVNVES